MKNELIKVHKIFEDLEYLGSGNHGHAYRLRSRAVKMTTDPQEVEVAKHLEGRKNRYIADIYGVNEVFESIDGKTKWYMIDMELLHASDIAKTKIKIGLSDFKTVWLSRYNNAITSRFSFWDLCNIYREDNTELISKVREKLKEDLINQDETYQDCGDSSEIERLNLSLGFFDYIHSAYLELSEIYDNARIDLNDGNFLVNRQGKLKCFDFQLYDISKIF